MSYNYNQRIQAKAATYDHGLRSYMQQVYNYMALALSLTGITAFAAANIPILANLLYMTDTAGNLVGMKPLAWIVSLAPIAMVFMLSAGLHTMTVQRAQALFWTYAALVGVSLSSLFLVYTGTSIARVFFICSSIFGAMSLYGYTTKKDLTGLGSFLMMGLIGIILASLVNIFFKSAGIQFAVSLLSILIFVGLTAYDTQKIKNIYYTTGGNEEVAAKYAIMGALSLYMDFINLFVQLIQFLGNRKEQ